MWYGAAAARESVRLHLTSDGGWSSALMFYFDINRIDMIETETAIWSNL